MFYSYDELRKVQFDDYIGFKILVGCACCAKILLDMIL